MNPRSRGKRVPDQPQFPCTEAMVTGGVTDDCLMQTP